MLQAPEEFIPDRFMEGTPEAAAVNPDAWVPFGGGVRACVGGEVCHGGLFLRSPDTL